MHAANVYIHSTPNGHTALQSVVFKREHMLVPTHAQSWQQQQLENTLARCVFKINEKKERQKKTTWLKIFLYSSVSWFNKSTAVYMYEIAHEHSQRVTCMQTHNIAHTPRTINRIKEIYSCFLLIFIISFRIDARI